jgi:signal transduction histidine kinase
VNQPLTALANYGRSAQMLLDAPAGDAPRLHAIIEKILREADRAAEVVRRLRDFFRAGTTRLETVPAGELLASARRIGESAIGDGRISLEVEDAEGLPPLEIDRLQIELVLRNLVANAVESLAASGHAGGRIRVLARRHGEHELMIAVIDNGPGLAPATREALFQPFVSGKPTGMGLGLAVSRAIAEAHGGSLEAGGAGHGEFHLILPCKQNR